MSNPVISFFVGIIFIGILSIFILLCLMINDEGDDKDERR